MATEITRAPEHDTEGVMHTWWTTKPFLAHVLAEELAKEHGLDKADVPLAFEGDPTQADEDHPVLIHMPPDLDPKKIERVFTAHTGEVEDPLYEIKAKLRLGEKELSLEEITTVLKHLIGA